MLNFIKNFRNDENGAVTVDWVVLTAAVVGLAVGAYTALDTNISALATGAATTKPSNATASRRWPPTPAKIGRAPIVFTR